MGLFSGTINSKINVKYGSITICDDVVASLFILVVSEWVSFSIFFISSAFSVGSSINFLFDILLSYSFVICSDKFLNLVEIFLPDIFCKSLELVIVKVPG